MTRAKPYPAGERGAALLTVLLIVAVISVLAASALEKLRLTTRLAGNGIAIDQARAYAMAGESLALTRIDAVLSRDAGRATLAGGWSGRPVAVPVPGGTASARVVDGGNCFNLNGLVTADGTSGYTARPASIAQFARLMTLLGVAPQTAAGIAAAAADWIDSDSLPQPQGAEDAAYARGPAGYRTANTLMADRSELRAVAGVTPEIYAKLMPLICALPRATPARINVNTLTPDQAVLLVMLLPDRLDVAHARAMLLARPPQGFASTVAFWNGLAQQGITAGPEAEEQTAITTQWFTLTVDVQLAGTDLTETALIDTTRLPARLVSRQWGEAS